MTNQIARSLKIIFSSLLFLILISACEKDEPIEPMPESCKELGFGLMEIINKTEKHFEIYMDGEFQFTIEPETRVYNIRIKEGSHHFKAEKTSAFVLVPRTIETSFNIARCQHHSWILK